MTFNKHNLGATAFSVRAARFPCYGFDETLPVVFDQIMWIDVLHTDSAFGFVARAYARYRQDLANVTKDPLANFGDVERYLWNVAERHPLLKRAHAWATTRCLNYDVVNAPMAAGHKPEVRRKFAAVDRCEPSFARVWLRLAQL